MKPILATLVIPLLLLLTACGPRPPSARGATPEEAAQRVIPKLSNPDPDNIELHGTHVTPHGTVVIFTFEHAGTERLPAQSILGYVLTEQRGATWVTTDVTEAFRYPPGEGSKYVRFNAHLFDRNGSVFAVYGLARSAEVTAVEVMFKNGQVVRDELTPEGIFVAMADDTPGYCRLKVLDARGQVLEEIRTDNTGVCAK